ncbi:MAG: PQQ-like beta-propeller repeat protein [Verrucomicrobia bacterium]|nr:PQQ-like beta-propeller repeat protein [Verrucomicrobiota bacterium]
MNNSPYPTSGHPPDEPRSSGRESAPSIFDESQSRLTSAATAGSDSESRFGFNERNSSGISLPSGWGDERDAGHSLDFGSYSIRSAKFFSWLLSLIVSISATAANFSDWPQILGPTRNGVYAGNDLAEAWPKEGPPVVWEKKIGRGFAGPAISAGKVILFHRLDDKESVDCLEAKSGKELWTFDYPTAYRDDFGFDDGPRAVPAIADGKVYTFGAEGALHCLDFATGKRIWNVDTKATLKAGKGYFGMACSPLVEGDAVLLNIGGANGAGVVAFDKATGKLLWKATSDEASYSSPTAATVNGKRRVFFLTRAGLVAIEPKTGKVEFQFQWRASNSASVNAATPLVIDDLVFLSASYQTGAVLLRVTESGVEKIWSGDDRLSNHYATSVYRDGFLYGFDGRADPGFQPPPSLRCVEFKTGKVRWSKTGLGAGTVTLTGDALLLLLDNGQLLRVAAQPDQYKETGRAQIFPTGIRAYPALAEGHLFARSKDKLFCVDLRKSKP